MQRRSFLGAALAAAPLARAWAQAPGAWPKAPVSVAFDFVQERRILVPISIGGRPAEAWLDTGSSGSVVDLNFARALGLPLGEPVRAAGVSGQVAGARLIQAPLVVAGLAMPARPLAAMDLSAVSEQSPRPVQVILGRELFDAAVVDIDFAARRLTLTARQAFRPPGGPVTPLGRAGGLRTVPVVLDGVATPALFDIGNTGALLVERSYAEAHGLMAGRRVSTQLAIGADGAHEQPVLSLAQVRLGGVRFRDVPAVAASGLAARAPANVGLDLLSRFRLTIDFAGDRLWLAPDRAAAEAPFRRNRSGLSVTLDVDRLVVAHVAPGSPAAAAGWRSGELITAIDGHPIDADYQSGPVAHWSEGPAGETVSLALAGGAMRRLQLADYY
ncbi:MAG TPA: pepsin/retropepsin-like aspartic protease family protein [Phenylobacterium sp.]|nr:pepsin/retropepsin-like aspartic protease family protein [Phenylobacterium sp.]